MKSLQKNNILYSATLVVLIYFKTVSCQSSSSTDYPMLIENCEWPASYFMSGSNGLILKIPVVGNHNLAPNLTCKARFYCFRSTLRMKVHSFNLTGPNDCGKNYEKFSFVITDSITYIPITRSIDWCGSMYPQEMLLPATYSDLYAVYNTGMYGEGPGFEIEFMCDTPESSNCYQEVHLNATWEPKLLYSPNYPSNYPNYLDCAVFIYSTAGQPIRIMSLLVGIEKSPYGNCLCDYLHINNATYCGTDPIYTVVYTSPVQIKFHTDYSHTDSGFILQYGLVDAENVTCTSANNYRVSLVDDYSFIVIQNDVPANSNDSCSVLLDSGSPGKGLAIQAITDVISNGSSYSLYSPPEQFTSRFPLTLADQQMRSNFFLSLDRYVIFSMNPSVRKLFLTAQNVNLINQPIVTQRSALLLITDVYNFVNSILVQPQLATNESIQIRIIDPRYNTTQPVSNYIKVYNGPNMTYFELTQACNGSRSNAVVVSSVSSETVTIGLLNSRSSKFWINITVTTGVHLPDPEEITTETFSQYFSINLLKYRNLYCRWKLSPSLEAEVKTHRYLIRFKITDNYGIPSYISNFLTLSDGARTLMSYSFQSSFDWLYSSDPVIITVSFFNVSWSMFPYMYFTFQHEIVRNISSIQPIRCQSQTLFATEETQNASSPNYPGYFQISACDWTIQSSHLYVKTKAAIMIVFPDLSKVLCSGDAYFQVYTADAGESDVMKQTVCQGPHNSSSMNLCFQKDHVKIKYFSSSPYLMAPGFQFQYKTIAPCNIRYLTAESSKKNLESSDLSSSLTGSQCVEWHISTKYSSGEISLNLITFRVGSSYSCTTSSSSYVAIYDGFYTTSTQKALLCGSQYTGLYVSSSSSMTVVYRTLDPSSDYFSFTYNSMSDYSYHSYEDPAVKVTDIGIFGIFIACVVGIVIFVCILFFTVRWQRRKRMLSNSRGVVYTTPPSNRTTNINLPNSHISVVPSPTPVNSGPPPYWQLPDQDFDSAPPPYSSLQFGANPPSSAPSAPNSSFISEPAPPYSAGTTTQNEELQTGRQDSVEEQAGTVENPVHNTNTNAVAIKTDETQQPPDIHAQLPAQNKPEVYD